MSGVGVQVEKRVRLCRVRRKRVYADIDMRRLDRVFAGLEEVSILGGNESSRFSYWAAEAVEVFEAHRGESCVLEKLENALGKYKLGGNTKGESFGGMFVGGWIGYFSYDLGECIEKIEQRACDDLGMPLIRLCFYDKVICWDSVEKVWRLFVLEIEGEGRNFEDKFAELEELIAQSEVQEMRGIAGEVEADIGVGKLDANMSREYYFSAFEKIKEHIYEGDVYQVNFSLRFCEEFRGDAVELFEWQNIYNGCEYAGFIKSEGFSIVSTSPEMFVRVVDGVVSTKPIKGTRARGSDEEVNRANFEELRDSEKEKAELNMIIDLERNDVGRICEAGTRKVVQERTIEEYPTVYHAVATVAGKLKKDVGVCGILRAMFPGGSITGAPKISAMNIIERLEPTKRGVYTGSIGYIGVDGNVCLNIAIRTIIIAGENAYVQVGSGIVADSDVQAEWDEALLKAGALLTGIRDIQKRKF